MTILNNILETIKYAIRQIVEVKKIYLLFFMLDVIRKIVISFCLLLIPQKLVNVMLIKNYQQGVGLIVFLCTLILISELLFAYINRMRNIMQVDINIKLNTKLSSSVMLTEYEKVEKKSFLEKVDFAKRCIDRNSVLVVYDNFIEVASGIISLVGIFYIISRLPILLVTTIMLAVVISAIGEVFRLNYVYDREYQGNEIERNLYYARNDLASNQYAKDIRVWDLYRYVSKKVEMYSKKLCDLWAKTSIKSVKIVGWTFIAYGVQYIIVYAFLAYMIYQGKIDVSEFILYSSATIAFGDIVKKVLAAFISVGAEYKYIENIAYVEETQGEKEYNLDEITFDHKIELVDVWYKYQGSDTYLFEGLNLVIEKDKTYSIVGKNGAGKTTLIKLILGLYKPEKGDIYIDGINLKCISMNKYRNLFACVFQDYNIYGFSIYENISFKELNIDKINEVISKSGIKEKIESLPEGLETFLNREVNDNAVMFSGGQEQQLAIARALYKDSDIFILDEPTAALSPNSEFALYQQFREIAYNKTVIFISHRLASCVLCDEVIVLDEGKIVEKGKHEDLMKNRGLYAEMFELQAKPYNE